MCFVYIYIYIVVLPGHGLSDALSVVLRGRFHISIGAAFGCCFAHLPQIDCHILEGSAMER